MRWIVRLAALALLLVLWGRLQERHDDLARAGETFEDQRRALERVEGDLTDLDAQIDALAGRLDELDRRISAAERTPDGRIPRDAYDAYLRLVEERNDVASEYNVLLAYQRRVRADYEAGVARHNEGVAEANTEARGTTPWAVVQDLWAELTAAWDRG
jgi:chromosome segregation ATPase